MNFAVCFCENCIKNTRSISLNCESCVKYYAQKPLRGFWSVLSRCSRMPGAVFRFLPGAPRLLSVLF